MIDNLKDAIKHCHEKAKELKEEVERKDLKYGKSNNPIDLKVAADCLECAKEHEQLAAWLEELKDYREGKRTCENCKHQNKAEDQYPCSICRCNHPNMFEWEKESEVKHG